MSGHFGILRTDGAAVREDFLKGIMRSLAFRGPDGVCIQAKGALGSHGRRGGMAYLLRLPFSPTEEDWSDQQQSSWFWGAVKRPFRLIRKYGQD